MARIGVPYCAGFLQGLGYHPNPPRVFKCAFVEPILYLTRKSMKNKTYYGGGGGSRTPVLR